MYRKATTFTILMISLLFLSRVWAEEAAHTWTIQTIWQPETVNQQAVNRFADNVERMSDGRLQIDIRPIGSVVGYTETVDAAGAGLITGHIAFPGYFSGKEPGLAAMGDLPAAYADPYQAQKMLEYGGGLELLQDMYAKLGMHTIGATWWGVESMPVKKEIRTVDDFQGVKIRAPQGMASVLFSNVGASVVNLPGSEVYGAFEKGVIDATDWGTLAMNEDIGLHDVATGVIYPGIHSMPMADISVSTNSWNQLSPDLQAILEVAVRDFARDMIQSNAMRDASALQGLQDQNVTQLDWSEDERQKFKQAAVEVWKEYGEESELAAEAIDLQLRFLKENNYLK